MGLFHLAQQHVPTWPSWSYTDITASLPDAVCVLQPPLTTDLMNLGQKLSVVAFQERKYRKVAQNAGCFLTCSHDNPRAGIRLARDVRVASCQAAGCEMSGQGCPASVCREPQRGQPSRRGGPVHPFLHGSALRDAAAPGSTCASQLGCSGRQDWHQRLRSCWIRG